MYKQDLALDNLQWLISQSNPTSRQSYHNFQITSKHFCLIKIIFVLRVLCTRRKIWMAGVRVPKRIDVSKLKDPVICMALNEKLSTVEFDDTWETFKDQVYTSVVEILSLKKSVHRDWFDDNDQEIKALLEAKKVFHETFLNDNLKNRTVIERNYKEHKAVLQRELRRMKNVWRSNIPAEVQSAYNWKYTKDLYSLLKQVFNLKTAPFVPLLTKDKSTLIKDPDKIREHFAELFFNPSVVDESAISSLPQLDILNHMDRLP